MGSAPSQAGTSKQGKKGIFVDEIKEVDEAESYGHGNYDNNAGKFEHKFDDDNESPDTDEIKKGKETLLKVIEFLKDATIDELRTQSALDTLLTVDGVLGDFSSYENMPKMKTYAKYLVEIGFPKVFALLWDKVRKPIDSGLDNHEESVVYVFALFEGCKTMIGGMCDQSKRFSCALGQAGIIKRLLTDLENPRLQPDKISAKSTQMEQDAIYGMLRSSIMCMHNCIKNWPDNKPYFREANAVELLHKYLVNCKNASIKSNSLFTLVYIVNEDESDRISAGEEIQFFINTLDSALKNSYSHHMCEVGDYTFTATEIVDGIIHLAANDANKQTLVQKGILPLLVKLLKEDCTEKENELAATAIWTLSFHDSNKDKIKEEPGCMDDLKRLKASKNETLKKACDGTLWQLVGMDQQIELQSLHGDLESCHGQETCGHVMISYQWDCQRTMIKVKDRLKAAGFNVWMDVEKMAGSTLEAMADAVEKADVVLICMSEKYKNSPSCRTEAEYTYKLGKDFIPIRVQENYSPDGWLGILIGTKLYFDISSEPRLHDNVPNIIRELGDRGKTKKKRGAGKGGKEKKTTKQVTFDSATDESTSVESWSNADVNKWLNDFGLAHMVKHFAGYDGKAILEFKMMEMRAPEFFYASLRNDMGFKNMLDLTRFTRGLRGIEI